jgi:hypothetical protein
VSTSASLLAELGGDGAQRVLPEAVLLLVAAHGQAHLEDRVRGAHQHLRLGHRVGVDLGRAERDPAGEHVAPAGSSA